MYFAVISIMPDMFSAICDFGITARALANQQIHIDCINPRNFTTDNYRRIDERPYGGGPGMVMMAEPLAKAINHAKQLACAHGCSMREGMLDSRRCPVVYLSPQGERLTESMVVSLTGAYKDDNTDSTISSIASSTTTSSETHDGKTHDSKIDGMILLCGRYEGVDERLIIHYVDRQISIGDYVLTGGELPAMVLMDTLIRRLPNVMGDDSSAEQDSFVDGLLDCPHYTKPTCFEGLEVPEVLLSGHHSRIAKWRFVQQVQRTQALRADMWQAYQAGYHQLTKQQKQWLDELINQNLSNQDG